MKYLNVTGKTVTRGPLTVYIASSWRNAHGVELLTKELREMGCEVFSWIENNYGENHNHVTKVMDFEAWVKSGDSDQSFYFDTRGACDCEVFIYYGPAGMDAACELGIAYASRNIARLGLWAKGEQLGLMRKMVEMWHSRPNDLIKHVYDIMVRHNCPILKIPS